MEVVDWALRVVMILVSIGVFVWGRSQKQFDELLNEKITTLRALIVDGKIEHEKVILLQLAMRDQQLLTLHKRFDQAGQKASDEANHVVVKIADLDHRLLVLETRLTRLSP